MLQRKGLPNWWKEKLEAQQKAAAAAARGVGGSGCEGGGDDEQTNPLKLDRGEDELMPTSRSLLATRISHLLARFADSVCSDVLGRVVRRLGRDTAALLLQSTCMHSACRRFARQVLDESRQHIMTGGFAASVWARWASVTHTSGNAIKVLREMSCNQRVDDSSDSDESMSEDSSAGDNAAELSHGKQRLVRNVMHPYYGRTFRPVPSPYMLYKECGRLRGGERALLALDGKRGATLSFTASLLASIRRARSAGILVNAAAMVGGDMVDKFCVRAMIAGDGFRAGMAKEVRIGVTLLTTGGLNQSPNDWTDFCLYSGNESYSAIKTFLSPVLHEIAELNRTQVVHDEAADQMYHVLVSLGGDLPWLMAFLGKKSINFMQGFSPYCLCPIPDMTKFDRQDHVLFTAETAAMLTHTSPEAAYYELEHVDFECPAVGCSWGQDKGPLVTAESREKFKQHLATLAEGGKHAAVKAALMSFARVHHGFEFDTPCLVKFEMICPDPLHAYLNVVVAVLSYGIRDRILIDSGDDPELKAIKEEACSLINLACQVNRVRLTFSTDCKDLMPKINGNAWKEMIKPGFFPDVLDALRLIHHRQTPVVAASNSATIGTAAAAAVARPKRSPYKPVAEQPAQQARRQRKTAAAGLRQRLDIEAAGLDEQMEEDGGLEAYLAAASKRIGQLGGSGSAALGSRQAEPSEESLAASAEAVAEEVRQAARSSFEYLFIDCLQSPIDHWAFVTEKHVIFIAERDGVSTQERTRLRDEAERLGRVVAMAFVALVGTSVRCSYLHAFVYAFPAMLFEL
eukprot:6187068-Pleurochrysis_carterae.AAC.1